MEVDSGKILATTEDLQYIDSDSKDNTDDDEHLDSLRWVSVFFFLIALICTWGGQYKYEYMYSKFMTHAEFQNKIHIVVKPF